MRIFYAADTTPNSSFQSNLWRHNLYEPLVDLGHELIEFQYDLAETFRHLDAGQTAFIARNRPKLSVELLRQIRAAHAHHPLDLFFSYFYDVCVLPETIDAIRAMGITTVNWYCNASYQFHLVAQISPHYDWCLVPEKFRLPDYLALGARPFYCQEAANPHIYKPYDLPSEFEVAFVGQAYGDRPAYIRYLLDQGIDVRVWGHGWDNFCPDIPNPRSTFWQQAAKAKKLLTSAGWKKLGQKLSKLVATSPGSQSESLPTIQLPARIVGGVLSDTAMVQMYSRAKINLGFSSCGDTHKTGERILQVRLRDFEVPMSGGFYMVEYMEELAEFFEIGKEIVCYQNRQDLAEKIRYYLAHEPERRKISQAGHERCLKDHTWHKRFRNFFQQTGIGALKQ